LSELSRTLFPTWTEGPLVAGELLARQAYWRFPGLREWRRRLRSPKKSAPVSIDRRELKDYLRQIGVVEGALVMAHTSVSQLQFTENNKPVPGGFLAAANCLVNDLLELVGPTGTLVMPTHAHYQVEDALLPEEKREQAIYYNPQTTSCAVGLANELFWRRKGVLRSMHPYNSLAAYGPLAEELLHDNLNRMKPLPHGVYSGYYRFSQKNGLVISIGVALADSMTLIHSPEEVRDQEWPIKDFFEERNYLIRIGDKDELYTIRQRRAEYGKYCICVHKIFRDLAREGILHESMMGNVRIDWIRSKDMFDVFMARNKHSHYPYYGIWLAR
jgi:aminoglycoside 3-N-acetyltransferase